MLGICHSATPLFLFPICNSALWQPSIRGWHHGDGAPGGVFIRPTGILRLLPANRVTLTSPTSRQRQMVQGLVLSTYTCLTNKWTQGQPTSGQRVATRCGGETDIEKLSPPLKHTAQTNVSLLPHLLNIFHVMKMVELKQCNSLFYAVSWGSTQWLKKI